MSRLDSTLHTRVQLLAISLVLAGCGPTPPTADSLAAPPLVQAAENGDLAVLDHLLAGNVPVNVRDECQWTPLMKASLNGHTEIVMRLLAAGAQPNVIDNGGYSALMLAASNDHPAIVNLLVRHGADIQHTEPGLGWSALIWAAKRGHQASVEILLKLGADKSIRDKAGKSAADWATETGHTRLAGLLHG